MVQAGERKKKSGIVVAGDVAIDWLQWVEHYDHSDSGRPSNWRLYPGTLMRAEPGGALLLARMVKAATGMGVATYELTGIEDIPPDHIVHSTAILDHFPSGGKEKTYRVKQYGGFAGPAGGSPGQLPVVGDDENAGLVVIDDAGNGFRDYKGAWPKAIAGKGKGPLVILKMGRPIGSGALWDHLVRSHAQNLVVIVGANDLRDVGISISRCLSWEQTAEDFRWQIANNPAIRSLAGCHHVIVRFGLDGAIYYRNDGKTISSRLFYDPASMEDDYRGRYRGDMQGVTNAFVAAVAREITIAGLDGIPRGIHAGIRRSRQFFVEGFGAPGKTPSYPIEKVFTAGGAEPVAEAAIPLAGRSDIAGHWTILEDCTRGRLESIAYRAVTRKEEDSLRNVPTARFGGLLTLDRSEIEGLQSIKNLITEYLGKKDLNVPLSIAVFGPPGSGKSFGVTQLATSLDPRIEKKEFNVSQFTSPIDLVDAFHKVRDMVLGGKIPLVFFDEFDSAFEGKLGWLKYFLAPMQDGAFKEGETMHPIGKTIFVFAGGTSHNFRQFSREYLDDIKDAGERERIMSEFRGAKGTDFVSRLRGYVDVLGPNRNGPDDSFFMIRRALLLRSLLKRKAPHLLDEQENLRIDPGVLRAFIKAPAYKHGARSMEAIIDMSLLAGREKFEQAALPSARQLELHVDSSIFFKLMLRDVLFNDAMERLAMEAHAQSVRDQAGKKKKTDPAMQPWEKLPGEFRESSRARTRQIPEKLQRVGLDFMPFTTRPETRFQFTGEQVEALAEMEHKRWMAERLNSGWVPGRKRNVKKKISPYLIPYSELPEDVKDRDRNPVRQIPELLEKAGFEVYPLQ